MTKPYQILMGLFGIILAMQLNAAERVKLTLTTEDYPPFNMTSAKNDGAEGISVDIVRLLLKRAQVDFTIGIYPWARAMEMAKDNPLTCVFSISRTPEREDNFKWVGPLVSNDWAIFANESDKRRPVKIEDISDAVFGSYVGDAIVKYLELKKYKVDVTRTDDVNPQKLIAKRIDYWATGKLIGQYILKQNKIKGIVPILTFNRTDMYLGCNKQMPNALILKLNTIIRKMRTNGEIKRIYLHHGYEP